MKVKMRLFCEKCNCFQEVTENVQVDTDFKNKEEAKQLFNDSIYPNLVLKCPKCSTVLFEKGSPVFINKPKN